MATPVTMSVVVPAGVTEGQLLNVTTPDGQSLQITVPAGVGEGSPIQFQYIPLADAAPPVETESVSLHPEDADAFIKAQEAKGVSVQAEAPVSAGTGEETFSGFSFQAAMFHVNDRCKVTRTSGEQTECIICSVHLTALGPQYEVYLGNDENGNPVTKCCDEADLSL